MSLHDGSAQPCSYAANIYPPSPWMQSSPSLLVYRSTNSRLSRSKVLLIFFFLIGVATAYSIIAESAIARHSVLLFTVWRQLEILSAARFFSTGSFQLCGCHPLSLLPTAGAVSNTRANLAGGTWKEGKFLYATHLGGMIFFTYDSSS